MIRTEKAKKYGGTKAIPLSEFDFIVPEQEYIIQDVEIDGEHCLVIKKDKGLNIKLKQIADR